MKYIIAITVSVLLLSSCTKEEITDTSSTEPDVFTVQAISQDGVYYDLGSTIPKQ